MISISKTRNKIINKKKRKENDFRLSLSLIIPHSKIIFLLIFLSHPLPIKLADTSIKPKETTTPKITLTIIILKSPPIDKDIQK